MRSSLRNTQCDRLRRAYEEEERFGSQSCYADSLDKDGGMSRPPRSALEPVVRSFAIVASKDFLEIENRLLYLRTCYPLCSDNFQQLAKCCNISSVDKTVQSTYILIKRISTVKTGLKSLSEPVYAGSKSRRDRLLGL